MARKFTGVEHASVGTTLTLQNAHVSVFFSFSSLIYTPFSIQNGQDTIQAICQEGTQEGNDWQVLQEAY
jgi:hypothetical protein